MSYVCCDKNCAGEGLLLRVPRVFFSLAITARLCVEMGSSLLGAIGAACGSSTGSGVSGLSGD